MFSFNTIVLYKIIQTHYCHVNEIKIQLCYYSSMNFWEKVDQERELKNLTRKELAHIAKFSLNSISTGIARNSIPAADVALRIANALGTTVECLMGQKNSQQATPPPIISAKKEALYKKYRNFIEDFDKLSLENQKAIIQIVTQIAH